jgi:hypothetical protein
VFIIDPTGFRKLIFNDSKNGRTNSIFVLGEKLSSLENVVERA